jgi:LacI family transcriptional regulator
MATIREVAKAAGVSTATVSNVLNGRLERVSTETQERVLATVRALKYRPTALEKNQKAILTQNVGVIVPDLTEGPLRRHNYFRNILDGVLESAALRGWSVTIFIERMWSFHRKNVERRRFGGPAELRRSL